MRSRIIPSGAIPRFFSHDNNLTTELNLMKLWYVVQLIKLNNVLKFHQISSIISGLLISIDQKTLVWSLRYSPTQYTTPIFIDVSSLSNFAQFYAQFGELKKRPPFVEALWHMIAIFITRTPINAKNHDFIASN